MKDLAQGHRHPGELRRHAAAGARQNAGEARDPCRDGRHALYQRRAGQLRGAQQKEDGAAVFRCPRQSSSTTLSSAAKPLALSPSNLPSFKTSGAAIHRRHHHRRVKRRTLLHRNIVATCSNPSVDAARPDPTRKAQGADQLTTVCNAAAVSHLCVHGLLPARRTHRRPGAAGGEPATSGTIKGLKGLQRSTCSRR